jgi:hypothetical protein
MPVIKPRTRGKQFVRHTTRLDRENNETLYAYAHFIGESVEYVLNQLVETFLGKDKEFLAWRTEHSDSYVPLPVRQRRKQRQAGNADRARSTAVRPAIATAG